MWEACIFDPHAPLLQVRPVRQHSLVGPCPCAVFQCCITLVPCTATPQLAPTNTPGLTPVRPDRLHSLVLPSVLHVSLNMQFTANLLRLGLEHLMLVADDEQACKQVCHFMCGLQSTMQAGGPACMYRPTCMNLTCKSVGCKLRSGPSGVDV